MRTLFISLVATVWASVCGAQSSVVEDVIDGHVLSGFVTLSEAAQDLSAVAQASCNPKSEDLRQAWGVAFDAWLGVSHLRFGFADMAQDAAALAYWPDAGGITSQTLARMIAEEEPAVFDPILFAQQPTAARGFYAMEYLLFDGPTLALGSKEYRCALLRAQAADIARVSTVMLADWSQRFAALMRMPDNGDERLDDPVIQALFTAVQTGLRVAAETRLGAPLGGADGPAPTRAESWRSERSLHNLVLTLHATEDLALRLAAGQVDVAQAVGTGYARVIDLAETLQDPSLAGVGDPQARLRIEVLQNAIIALRDMMEDTLAPAVGLDSPLRTDRL